MRQVTTRALGDDFAAPRDDRWFEDFEVGASYEYGYLDVTDDEVVEFAERFDPQRMHTDPQWAATGPFGGLIASGWHSGGLLMRLYADHYLSTVASLASPGVDELRWAAPLRPGDRVRLRVAVTDARPSSSRPDRGIVHTAAELRTDDDRCPISLRAVNLFLRRPDR